MLIERQLEDDFITTLKSMPELSASQVVGSREVAADGETKTEDDSHATVVAVACGFRQNDAFSLSPITMQMSIAVMTRTELDPTSEGHSKVIEAIADLLSQWHKDGNAMTEALSNEKFFAGELRMDGGTARTYDSMTQTWSETINFSIRGAERFQPQPEPKPPIPEWQAAWFKNGDRIIIPDEVITGSWTTGTSWLQAVGHSPDGGYSKDMEQVAVLNPIAVWQGLQPLISDVCKTLFIGPQTTIANPVLFDFTRGLEAIYFIGRTIEEVQAMDGYPWHLSDTSKIQVI